MFPPPSPPIDPTTPTSPELRSEEIQDIISSVPVWIVRWGTTVFFLLMVLILLVSCMRPSLTIFEHE